MKNILIVILMFLFFVGCEDNKDPTSMNELNLLCEFDLTSDNYFGSVTMSDLIEKRKSIFMIKMHNNDNEDEFAKIFIEYNKLTLVTKRKDCKLTKNTYPIVVSSGDVLHVFGGNGEINILIENNQPINIPVCYDEFNRQAWFETSELTSSIEKPIKLSSNEVAGTIINENVRIGRDYLRARKKYTKFDLPKNGRVYMENKTWFNATHIWQFCSLSGDDISFYFCHKNNENTYQVDIGLGQIVLKKRENGALKKLVSSKLSLPLWQWNKLAISQYFGLITISFDNNILLQYFDENPILFGGIGYGTEQKQSFLIASVANYPTTGFTLKNSVLPTLQELAKSNSRYLSPKGLNSKKIKVAMNVALPDLTDPVGIMLRKSDDENYVKLVFQISDEKVVAFMESCIRGTISTHKVDSDRLSYTAYANIEFLVLDNVAWVLWNGRMVGLIRGIKDLPQGGCEFMISKNNSNAIKSVFVDTSILNNYNRSASVALDKVSEQEIVNLRAPKLLQQKEAGGQYNWYMTDMVLSNNWRFEVEFPELKNEKKAGVRISELADSMPPIYFILSNHDGSTVCEMYEGDKRIENRSWDIAIPPKKITMYRIGGRLMFCSNNVVICNVPCPIIMTNNCKFHFFTNDNNFHNKKIFAKLNEKESTCLSDWLYSTRGKEIGAMGKIKPICDDLPGSMWFKRTVGSNYLFSLKTDSIEHIKGLHIAINSNNTTPSSGTVVVFDDELNPRLFYNKKEIELIEIENSESFDGIIIADEDNQDEKMFNLQIQNSNGNLLILYNNKPIAKCEKPIGMIGSGIILWNKNSMLIRDISVSNSSPRRKEQKPLIIPSSTSLFPNLIKLSKKQDETNW